MFAVGCPVRIFVNPAAEAFGSLLTAWPVLLAVFGIATELANIPPHRRNVEFLLASFRSSTDTCDEQDMWTHFSDLSSLVHFLTNTRLDSKLGKFSKSEIIPNANF